MILRPTIKHYIILTPYFKRSDALWHILENEAKNGILQCT